MKRTAIMINILLFILIYCSSSFAQVKPGAVSVTPYVGGIIFDKEHHLNNTPIYGLKVGYDFTRYFGIEASGNGFFTQYDQAVANVDQGSNGLNYRLDGIFHLLPRYRFTPFLTAGVGGQSINYPRGMQNTTAFAVDYGGGVKFFMTDWLVLSADIRQMYVFDNAKKDIEYGLGLSFLIGGSKASPSLPAGTGLQAPIDLSATAISESQNKVSWKDVPGASNYRIYRDGLYLKSASSPSLDDAGLKSSTQYCYMVTAVDKDGRESERTNQACATTLSPSPALSAINDITASAVSEFQINVAWTEVVGAKSYKIYRDGTYLTASKTPSLSDTGLKSSTAYCYVVSAVDDAGRETDRSKEACATTLYSTEEQKRRAEAAASASVQKEMLGKGRATIDIEFDYNKAIVKPQYYPEIKKFADVIKANPGIVVSIEGHTDNIGTKDYNQKLSLKRAESVRNTLVTRFGIPAASLKAKGFGLSRPIATNKTADGRKKNRRVEAVVVYNIKK
ncbi:MAG: OmpA family protein [Syntrophus sp. SKADARSKE-3]|nr:OmpA family protein [Syntrophus sp. SKADARSKE-3]